MTALKKVNFGPIKGTEGKKYLAISKPYFPFEAKKLIASDSLSGAGTKILQIFVSGESQIPSASGQGGIPTLLFSAQTAGNEVVLKACESEQLIAIEVEFLADCQWDGELVGELSLPKPTKEQEKSLPKPTKEQEKFFEAADRYQRAHCALEQAKRDIETTADSMNRAWQEWQYVKLHETGSLKKH